MNLFFLPFLFYNLLFPSTLKIKVRIKGARKLPPMDRPSSTLGFLPSSVAAIGSSSATGTSGSSGGGGGGTVSASTDAYVTVTLGGHSGLVADHENEDLQHDYYHGTNNPNTNTTTTTSSAYSSTFTSETNNSSAGNKKCYTARTKVCRRTLNPTWEEEFRFEVADDTLLQDEPLIFRVMDSTDAISSDESIGLVYIDLNPLLTLTATDDDDNMNGDVEVNEGGRTHSNSDVLDDDNDGGASDGVINGWFPLYDTLGGVRGELGLSVKLNFIGDVNPFRDSSAGVQLFPFSTLDPASGYTVLHVFGFVEELVVADDPEFEWKNNFRQARTSNETRQSLLYLLDLSVRRRMCKKVLEVSFNLTDGKWIYYRNFL